MASAGRVVAGAGVALGGVDGGVDAGPIGVEAGGEEDGEALERVGLGAEDLDPELLLDELRVVLTDVDPLLPEVVAAGIVDRELDAGDGVEALEEGAEDGLLLEEAAGVTLEAGSEEEAGEALGDAEFPAPTEFLLLFSLVGESPNIEFIDSSAEFVTFVKSLKYP